LKRDFQLPAVEEVVEGRLKEAKKPVLEEDGIGGRADADAVLLARPRKLVR
jgi:hypothetical protein